MRGLLAVLCLLASTGCLAPFEDAGSREPPAAVAEKVGPSFEVWHLDPTEWGEGEAIVVASPLDPDVALVAAHAHRTGGRRVFAATTVDGGASWSTWQAPLPETPVPAEVNVYDPTAAFGRDGALHVLYLVGIRPPVPAATVPYEAHVVLATSRDGGASWTTTRLPDPSRNVAWDYTALAAAPDSDDVYALVNVVGAGPWFWRSEDGGASWSDPMPLASPTRSTLRPLVSIPHVVAGPEGLVVASVRAEGALQVTRSFDGGRTFGPFAPAIGGVGGAIGRGLALRGVDEPVDAVVGVERALVRATAADARAAFGSATEARRLASGLVHGWVMAAPRGPDVAVLTDIVDTQGARWGMSLHLLGAQGVAWSVDLAPVSRTTPPRAGAAGNDYGGVSVGADGSIWASWSDPRGGEERVAVARVRVIPTFR